MTNISLFAFKPYPYNWCDENGVRYEISLIALAYNGHIVKLTDFHKYIGDKDIIEKWGKSNQDDVRRVCNFLSFILFKQFWKYGVKSISEIPFIAVKDYISQYVNTKNRFDDYPSKQSVIKELRAISLFMMNLTDFRQDGDKHYYAKKFREKIVNHNFSGKNNDVYETSTWIYEIKTNYRGEFKYNLVRDIPQNAISIILKWVQLMAPELYFAVVLQMCAGLRSGEVVNVRRSNSIYSNGISYTKENGKFTSFEINLEKEYLLRSDGMEVGHIKTKRIQSISPVYLPIVQKAYELHLKLVPSDQIENEKPMFVTCRKNFKTGKYMALTKQSYCNRIVNIVNNYVVPELLVSDETELKVFAMKMNERKWGLHAFRHWFTVQLVLNNEDINTIAFLRGDRSRKTAFLYLQDKGVLQKKYAEVNNEVTDDIMNMVTKMEKINE